MAASEAGASGSSFDVWAGRSNMPVGAAMVHTVASVFDYPMKWVQLPPPPPPLPPPRPPPPPFPMLDPSEYCLTVGVRTITVNEQEAL